MPRSADDTAARGKEAADLIFKAAAVADYTPASYSDNKVKKKDGTTELPLQSKESAANAIVDKALSL